MPDYQIATTRVSESEMNFAPLQTVRVIYEWHGWHWASRLWEEWHNSLPKQGAANIPLWNTSRDIKEWLDERRPIEGGTNA